LLIIIIINILYRLKFILIVDFSRVYLISDHLCFINNICLFIMDNAFLLYIVVVRCILLKDWWTLFIKLPLEILSAILCIWVLIRLDRSLLKQYVQTYFILQLCATFVLTFIVIVYYCVYYLLVPWNFKLYPFVFPVW